ncbi:putative 2,5-didehydrogluconate reductase (2-dehydro-D-gluconate-forming) [Candidatus Kuenenia stuttgartiensis]|uniref:Putative 2,5-didehydrogluconate reductase (2-dehydro-D-gluconate-forming) n=1 Tax=Kuenenia stuttgartiensis TaxID=174633 RepID=A0A6G7GKH7_KUEST|nr:aldo/keto reductase [Candidatus Kuenenia stuttgartiensis]MBE7546205.1 aldo/keto reductase [Planctomycetia bacterium]QII09854.1 putative 2,5-didehydrogluconate reductase (2-dehydro-D-gluconate-forming) [Candidatus Kuenenia stuttgartiensis]GJQ50033.1 MAG: aldo/keto reductase [Candidatus Kuenenia stuttgartiensis]
MEFKNLSNNIKIPVIGLGTWTIGGGDEADTTYDKENISAIKTAIKLGITHIDNAEAYAQGHSEELVGRAIVGLDRKSLFITSKVSPEHLSYDNLLASAKGSLQRLNTDYIDLYLIHAPNPDIPIQETMKAMDFLVEQKLVRCIGVSNFSVDQIKEAQKYTKNKIVANQIEYNLLVRDKGRVTENMESEIIPYCQENNIFIIAWRPLAKDKLAKPGFKILDELADKYHKTQAQIAINWLISKKGIVVISKSTKVEHLEKNLGAIGWKLRQEDTDRLNNEFINSRT